MKTITQSGKENDGLLHVEADGCIVNIRTGLVNAQGKAVTRIEILTDHYSGEREWAIEGEEGQHHLGVRVIQETQEAMEARRLRTNMEQLVGFVNAGLGDKPLTGQERDYLLGFDMPEMTSVKLRELLDHRRELYSNHHLRIGKGTRLTARCPSCGYRVPVKHTSEDRQIMGESVYHYAIYHVLGRHDKNCHFTMTAWKRSRLCACPKCFPINFPGKKFENDVQQALGIARASCILQSKINETGPWVEVTLQMPYGEGSLKFGEYLFNTRREVTNTLNEHFEVKYVGIMRQTLSLPPVMRWEVRLKAPDSE